MSNRKTSLYVASFLGAFACSQVHCAVANPSHVVTTHSTVPQRQSGPHTSPALAKKQSASALTSFEIRGALAAKSKSKGWTATMNWVQRGPNAYQIRLMGPLGGGSVVISRQGGVVSFKEGRKTLVAKNAEELLFKRTGIRLPVSSLYYWVRGLPAPGHTKSEQFDSAHHLVQLKQSGYTINFEQYTVVYGVAVPNKIRLEGNGVMIKVSIKSWSA